MILVDANLLVYAVVEEMPDNARAARWLEERLNGVDRMGIPWPSLVAFLRVVTNSRVFRAPMDSATAWRQVEAWIACPIVWIPNPTPRHVEIFGKLVTDARATGNLVHDAHLAALALEHGLTVASTDGDFARFSGVRWVNPLATRRTPS